MCTCLGIGNTTFGNILKDILIKHISPIDIFPFEIKRDSTNMESLESKAYGTVTNQKFYT